MEDVKRTPEEENDELRPEYDLKSLEIRRLGPGRKTFGKASIERDEVREYSSPNRPGETPDEPDLC
jgi:hypothetical protein